MYSSLSLHMKTGIENDTLYLKPANKMRFCMSTLKLGNHFCRSFTLHSRPHLSFLRHVNIKTRAESMNNSIIQTLESQTFIPLNLFPQDQTRDDSVRFSSISSELIGRNQKMDSSQMFGLEGALGVFRHLYLHAELLRSS